MTAFDSTRREAPRLPRDDFDVPFEEALRWARERKAVLPEEFYGARLQAVRARSFSIAGLSALDQLQQVADSLAEATAAGQTMREWQRTLPSEVFSLGRARRELIFRNAVQTHYGIGRTIQQRENATARPFLMWDAINDSRTRPAHAAMDGHIAPIDDAIWKTWTPPAGHNCFLPGTRVRGDFRIGLQAPYAGPAVEVSTRSGARLAVTGNHPVLTRYGWVAAQGIKAGDQLLRYGVEVDTAALAVEHDQQAPPTVEEVFDALGRQALGRAQRSAFKLHGDAQFGEGEIHVAGADGELVHGFEPVHQHGNEHRQLEAADDGVVHGGMHPDRMALSRAQAVDSGLAQNSLNVALRHPESVGNDPRAYRNKLINTGHDLLRLFVAAICRSPRGGTLTLNSGAVVFHGGPLCQRGLTAAAGGYAVSHKQAAHGPAGDAGPCRKGLLARACGVVGDQLGHVLRRALRPRLGARSADGVAVLHRAALDAGIAQQTAEQAIAHGGLFQALTHGFPGQVSTDQVVGVRHFTFRGHVYDFETTQGWLAANGVIVSNCRCTRISLTEAQARARGYPKAAPQVQPDKGWEGDPTDDDAAGRILADRIARAPYSMAEALRLRGRGAPVVDDQQRNAPDCDLLDGSRFAAEWCIGPRPGQVTWKDAGRPDLRRVDDALRLVQPAMLPRAESRADAAAVLAKALGLSDAEPLLSVATPVENALLRVDLLQHMVDKEEDARERYANFILPTLRDPFEVWAVDYADGIRNRYIGLFRGPRDFMVVLRVNLDGSLTWNIMQARPKDMNMHRIGALRYGK